MKSKTKIEAQLMRKTNPALVETVILAKKNPAWFEVAHVLTDSRRNRRGINVGEVFRVEGDVAVCGKLLSSGEASAKKKVIAMGFSAGAMAKLKKAGCEAVLLKDEILKNKEMNGVTLLK